MNWELRMMVLKNDPNRLDPKILQNCSCMAEIMDKLVPIIVINYISGWVQNLEIKL